MTEKPKRTYTRKVWAVVYKDVSVSSRRAPLYATKELAIGSLMYKMFRKALKVVPATITYRV